MKNVLSLFKRSYSAATAQVAYVTDSEGTNGILNNIKNSRILEYRADSGLHFLKKASNPYFIFGGDATDRGRMDLQSLSMLIDFKRRHFDRVILLVGNRDIKQCRFKLELHPKWIRERLLHSESPRWLPHKTFPRDYLIQKTNCPLNKLPEYVNSLSIQECQLLYLKWMLEKTMGCPNTFRYRCDELTSQFQRRISDEEVLASFIKESLPNGLFGQYLQLAQVGVIIPNTRIMAVHGGLTSLNIGKPFPGSTQSIPNAIEWIKEANTWYAQQIQKWKVYEPTQLITSPANTELDESVFPKPGYHKWLITADMLGAERKFVGIAPEVSNYLNQNNISLVLTGHQPCGDSPALLRDHGNKLLFINGDTSYAKPGANNEDDTRGDACHTLEVMATPYQTQIQIQATLSDMTTVKTELTLSSNGIVGDPYIGKLLPNSNLLIQCKLNDSRYRLIEQKKFDVKYSVISAEELDNIYQPCATNERRLK